MTKCPECGMGYVKGLPDNERQHRQYHDRVVYGLRAQLLKSDQTIWQASEQRITVVTARSPIAQRRRAQTIASLANLETRYNGGIYHAAEPPDEREIHLFLYHQCNRARGITVLERRPTIWRCRWCNGGPPSCEELRGHEPMWAVAFLWAHRRSRRQGIARRLIAQAMHHLRVSLDQLGWYTPFTDDGRVFVKALCPNEFYVAK